LKVPTQADKIDNTMANVRPQLEYAINKHKTPLRSPHEAAGVMIEEVLEALLALIKNERAAFVRECLQIAAMGARADLDSVGWK
jgi:hypothetical protein